MAFEILFLILLPALFIAAAVWDLASFTIPNFLILALLSLFILFAGAAGMSGAGLSWSQAGLHLLAGTIGLAIGMVLFAAGLIGGGDAKLFAVAALWLGINTLFEYTLMASILGGLLTLGLLFMRRLAFPSALMKYEWFARLTDRKAGIPYGVALSAAALLVLPKTELFALVVGR
jgi:prepilin peptidase CpaA